MQDKCDIGVTIPQLQNDNCKGRMVSTDCINYPQAITYLGLSKNSTATEVVNSVVYSISDTRVRLGNLEGEVQDIQDKVEIIDVNIVKTVNGIMPEQGNVEIPSTQITKTNGYVPSQSPFSNLIYDINILSENGEYHLPELTQKDIGKEILVRSGASSARIKPFLGQASISSDNPYGHSGSYMMEYNDKVLFTYLGNDYWFATYLYGSKLIGTISGNFLIVRGGRMSFTDSLVINDIVTGLVENVYIQGYIYNGGNVGLLSNYTAPTSL